VRPGYPGDDDLNFVRQEIGDGCSELLSRLRVTTFNGEIDAFDVAKAPQLVP
jgi:hypothetical protein